MIGTRKELEADILRLLRKTDTVTTPLPTTRELGERFNLSHVTVARVMKRMVEDKLLWQSKGGRFYSPEAEALLARPQPVGCLIRGINAWASWYPHLMGGVSDTCEGSGRGMLIHPVNVLLKQERPDARPGYASPKEQQAALQTYMRVHASECAITILDDLWDDEVLARYASEMPSPRMLLRVCAVEGVESAYPDYEQGALLAVSHFLSRGYEKVIVARPFRGYGTVDQIVAAFEKTSSVLGGGDTVKVVELDGNPKNLTWLKAIARSHKRVGIFCPEDNFSVALHENIVAAGYRIPEDVGILAGLGSEMVSDRGFSSLSVNFEQLGRLAASANAEQLRDRSSLRLKLAIGSTT